MSRFLTSEDGESGYTLIEASVVVAIISLGVGGVLGALAAVSDRQATTTIDAQLQASARNLIADLRAATAYESAAQASHFNLGTGTAVAMPQPMATGTPLAISCLPSITNGTLTVVCTNAAGRSARAQALVGQQAPAPGSTVLYNPSPAPP